jgi:hypothetical protein
MICPRAAGGPQSRIQRHPGRRGRRRRALHDDGHHDADRGEDPFPGDSSFSDLQQFVERDLMHQL